MVVLSSRHARGFVPRAAVRSRPHNNTKMPGLCCPSARGFIPGAAVRPCPLQDIYVPILRCRGARAALPGAVVLPSAFEELQLPQPGNVPTKGSGQGPAVCEAEIKLLYRSGGCNLSASNLGPNGEGAGDGRSWC